jgi:hypothetical protein
MGEENREKVGARIDMRRVGGASSHVPTHFPDGLQRIGATHSGAS